jgi:hypothetical protein
MSKKQDARLKVIRHQLSESGSAIVNRWAGGKSAHTAAWRFFNNKSVKLDSLIKSTQETVMRDITQEGHILVLQDTSEFNYNHLSGLLKVNDSDIGLLSDDKSVGFYLHLGLAVGAQSGLPLGLSSIQMWSRPFGSKNKSERGYRQLPIEEKSSYKWIRCANESKEELGVDKRLTLVGDRENDIYEFFAGIPDKRTSLLVRSSWNRKLSTGNLLHDDLEGIPWSESFTLKVQGNKHRLKREALMRIKWTTVRIAKPEKKKAILKDYADHVEINVVHVQEDPSTVPPSESPLDWCLFTTHAVDNLADALQIVDWYKWRWFIEDFFRILKTEGLEVESSQFSTGMALQKLLVVCLGEAFKILVMRQDRLGEYQYPASVCFNEEQQVFLKALCGKLEGKTPKQKNPFRQGSLAWATWTIAVLGNWIPGDLVKRPPGVITIARGLKHFYQRFDGWKDALRFFQEIPPNTE